jgi:hypothetical protein
MGIQGKFNTIPPHKSKETQIREQFQALVQSKNQ